MTDTRGLSGEDTLVAALAARLPMPRQTRLAIGDDAAAIAQPDGHLLLVTTDLLMEGVHFRLSWDDLPALGWKALAQNLSDIAAMGGTPTHGVVALALPPSWTLAQATLLYDGLADLAARAETDIIGGDTVRSTGPLILSLTVLGRVAPEEMLTRAGARPGDALYVTGTLGRAAAGLQLLESGHPVPQALLPAVQAQLRPQPRLAAARALATSGQVTAMMDLSDGLATDLHRLCRASNIGACIERETLPVDPVVTAACHWLGDRDVCADPVYLALTGGEDFELLFCATPTAEADLRARLAPLPLTRVGRMTANPEIVLRTDGTPSPLPWGFTHF